MDDERKQKSPPRTRSPKPLLSSRGDRTTARAKAVNEAVNRGREQRRRQMESKEKRFRESSGRPMLGSRY